MYAHVLVPDLIFGPHLPNPVSFRVEVLKVIKSTPELMYIPIVVAAVPMIPSSGKGRLRTGTATGHQKPGELHEIRRDSSNRAMSFGRAVTLSVPNLKRQPRKLFNGSSAATDRQDSEP